jgi:hypothetical protein
VGLTQAGLGSGAFLGHWNVLFHELIFLEEDGLLGQRKGPVGPEYCLTLPCGMVERFSGAQGSCPCREYWTGLNLFLSCMDVVFSHILAATLLCPDALRASW